MLQWRTNDLPGFFREDLDYPLPIFAEKTRKHEYENGERSNTNR